MTLDRSSSCQPWRNEQRTANSEQQTANSEQRTANSEQRTANSEQRIANSKQRVEGRRRSDVTDFKLRIFLPRLSAD
jgi:hypothetical protein